jgi:hypothetical protein
VFFISFSREKTPTSGVDGLQIEKTLLHQNNLEAQITKTAVAYHWTFARSFHGNGSVAIIGPTVSVNGCQNSATHMRTALAAQSMLTNG